MTHPVSTKANSISSDIPLFVNIELTSSVANSSRSTSAGLGNQPNAKKKRVNNVYSHSVFYKKPKNSKVGINVVDSSAGSLNLANIGNIDDKFSKSWNSKIESKANCINGLLDLENMKNTVANLDALVVNDMKDNTTPKKICTYIYILS
ncbi:hypothetical protein G9A89_006195 [Geosiphon pyriformis]|nr:hypothetical protein G9A89_006195 [Geosiphon pyriformis]